MKFKLGEKVCYSAKLWSSERSTYRSAIFSFNKDLSLFVGTIVGIDSAINIPLVYLLSVNINCEDADSADTIQESWGRNKNIVLQSLDPFGKFIWFGPNGIQERCKCRNK